MIWGKLGRTAFSTAYLHLTSVVESGTTSTVTSTHFSVYLWEGGLATAVRLGGALVGGHGGGAAVEAVVLGAADGLAVGGAHDLAVLLLRWGLGSEAQSIQAHEHAHNTYTLTHA